MDLPSPSKFRPLTILHTAGLSMLSTVNKNAWEGNALPALVPASFHESDEEEEVDVGMMRSKPAKKKRKENPGPPLSPSATSERLPVLLEDEVATEVDEGAVPETEAEAEAAERSADTDCVVLACVREVIEAGTKYPVLGVLS